MNLTKYGVAVGLATFVLVGLDGCAVGGTASGDEAVTGTPVETVAANKPFGESQGRPMDELE
jgi:hypothetical protein